MKKIYITGIAGLLGSNIAIQLKSKYQITGVDLIAVDIPDVQCEVFDLLDYEKLQKSIEREKPDVLVHTVAIVNVDKCEREPKLAEEINAQLTAKIADICAENQIKMIYISTDSVFDGTSEEMYTEMDRVNPLNEYAKTKYKGELYTSRYERNLILRTNIYGLNIQHKQSFGEWIVCALENGEELNMFEDIYFSPILVSDLAHIIGKCVEKDLRGLYHACGTGVISKYDFGVATKKIFAIETGKINRTTSESVNFEALRPKNMGMSNRKISEELQMTIRTPEESIYEFHRLYIEKRIRER